MTTIVFVGPTLGMGDLSDVSVRPPVAQGDVYRATRSRPAAIGIIDGYFDGVPAVWHKEILFAMAEGIHVFGSASMGALRAAELSAFGMVGVGEIFEAYRAGRLEDDDDVAVLHGPAESGFQPLSEPMVNVRATLERALGEQIVSRPVHDRLARVAKQMAYRERTWPRILDRAADEAFDHALRARLEGWLDQGRVDQKRLDAIAMLDAMRGFLAEAPPPKRVDFHFQWTAMWDDAIRASDTDVLAATETRATSGTVLEELKLQPGGWAEAGEAAFQRLLCTREAERRRLQPGEAEIRRAIAGLREHHGLWTREALERWLAANHLDPAAFERLMVEEARIQLLAEAVGEPVEGVLLDYLRLGGDYPSLDQRAKDKARCLQAAGALDADPGLIGMTPRALRRWFFETRLGQPVPDDVAGFARASGFATPADFDAALAREYVYLHPPAGSAADG